MQSGLVCRCIVGLFMFNVVILLFSSQAIKVSECVMMYNTTQNFCKFCENWSVQKLPGFKSIQHIGLQIWDDIAHLS